MIEAGKTYVVMGLLDADSIAYAIGKTIESFGGKVIFTVQSERMKKIFFDRSKKLTDADRENLDIRFCDVTNDEEVKALFDSIEGPISGMVHSIGFSNPKTCLGEEFHTDAYDDLMKGFQISAVSLATVTRYAAPKMVEGGSVVTLTFASERAFAFYNWMGVNKAALEAVVRGLARRHGKENVRVNAVSAGPVFTIAAKHIPGFEELGNTWKKSSPLNWDPKNAQPEVAGVVAFLLGNYSKQITGQTIYVDGGASIIGGELMPHELPEGS
ncbi:SDR family oxidoreductase [Kiritimatiellaeota bacterium B1221]|nr:SDR family oxidoreductase [Kiritimatiellaeota bacterium B1221]